MREPVARRIEDVKPGDAIIGDDDDGSGEIEQLFLVTSIDLHLSYDTGVLVNANTKNGEKTRTYIRHFTTLDIIPAFEDQLNPSDGLTFGLRLCPECDKVRATWEPEDYVCRYCRDKLGRQKA